MNVQSVQPKQPSILRASLLLRSPRTSWQRRRRQGEHKARAVAATTTTPAGCSTETSDNWKIAFRDIVVAFAVTGIAVYTRI